VVLAHGFTRLFQQAYAGLLLPRAPQGPVVHPDP
jgi:hypothetical protein